MAGSASTGVHPASVILVGFMASGKSAVGRALAVRLGVPFVDCDAEIERRHGSIADIFASAGEAGFRRLERGVTVQTLGRAAQAPHVVALGGGAVGSADVRAALRSFPCVVWLTAPVEVLWKRACGVAGTRPLATEESAFAGLLTRREPLYSEVATMSVANDGTRPLAPVVDEIVAALARSADSVETSSVDGDD